MDFSKCVKEIEYNSEWYDKPLKLRCDYNTYQYGGVALELMMFNEEDEYYEPYMRASVCVDGLEDDEIAIKNYSENEGIYDALLQQKVIHKAHRFVPSGFVMVPVCHLFLEGEDEDFQLPFNPPFEIDMDSAYRLHWYMEGYSRREDVLQMLEDNPKFVSLSNKEKNDVIFKLAEEANNILADTSNWYDVTEAIVNDWKEKNA